jgi:menaquinone-dependent protoporphyrinogen oxidase
MDGERILVTTATKMGSTAEIGESIAERLRGAGLPVDTSPAGEVSSLKPYRAVVLGSATYMMRWRREAGAFLRRFRRELAERDLWLFQSGPLDHSAEEKAYPLPQRIEARLGDLRFRGHATFGGRIDPEHAKGFITSSMVKKGLGQDFRNFDQIDAWADAIAHELRASTSVG